MTIPLVNNFHASTDILIIAALVFVGLYGLVLGHGKLRTLAMSAYVGLVLASELGDSLHKAVASLSPLSARLALYFVPIVLLEFSRRHHDPGGHRGLIITLLLAVATTGLLVSGYMTQLGPEAAKHFADTSSLGYVIYQLRLVWIAVVPGLVVMEAFAGANDHKRH